jgi:hypothetical protein
VVPRTSPVSPWPETSTRAWKAGAAVVGLKARLAVEDERGPVGPELQSPGVEAGDLHGEAHLFALQSDQHREPAARPPAPGARLVDLDVDREPRLRRAGIGEQSSDGLRRRGDVDLGVDASMDGEARQPHGSCNVPRT